MEDLPASRDESNPLPINSSGDTEGGAAAEETGPHGALFLVLAYLRLPDLFAFQQSCKLFRDAIAEDSLLWRRIVVEQPLSGKLTDDALLRITSKAGGKVSSLALLCCWRITDAGLLRLADQNPDITKLYVPGCMNLTGDGVVGVVERLSAHNGKLKRIWIHGLSDITKEHLDTLRSFLHINELQQGSEPFFYSHNEHPIPPSNDYGRPIDVDICPKCQNVRMVFDCTREKCRSMKKNIWIECRGCFFCIARCEECGGCIDSEELEDAACSDFLCSKCWIQLPKCNTCNRPYCKRHAVSLVGHSTSAGFTCEQCLNREEITTSYGFMSSYSANSS